MKPMDEIYQQYARTIYRFLLSLTHNDDLAEELTQETFYQAIRTSSRYDESCTITTWLCGIARNVLYTWRRKHPPEDSIEERGDEPSDALAAQDSPTETAALQAMDRVDLFQKLHGLPEPFREVLYLRIFGNLSFKEISKILGKTENWARVTFYRGKEKLLSDISPQI